MSIDNSNNNKTKPIKERSVAFQVFVPFFTCLFFIIAIVFAYSTGVKDGENSIKQKMPKTQEQPQAKQEEKKTEQKESKPEVKPEENKIEQKNVAIKSNYKNIKGEEIKIDNSDESFIRYAGTIAGACNEFSYLLDFAKEFITDEANFSTKDANECVDNICNYYDFILSLSKKGIPEIFVNDYNKFCEKLTRAKYLATVTFGYDPDSKKPKVVYVYPKNAYEIGTILDEVSVFRFNAYEVCTKKGLGNKLPG